MALQQRRRHLLLRYLSLSSLVLLVALIGYSSFMTYPLVRRSSTVGSGLIILALAAGLASLFSPCSFPLLLTVLAREATHSKRALLKTAVAFTLGMITFLMLLGGALAAGAGSVISQITFTSSAGRILRFSVGLILIAFGLWQIQGKSLSFIWLNQLLQPLWHRQTRWRRKSTSLGYGLYGFGYILAGFG